MTKGSLLVNFQMDEIYEVVCKLSNTSKANIPETTLLNENKFTFVLYTRIKRMSEKDNCGK